jgi:hypothetical protein
MFELTYTTDFLSMPRFEPGFLGLMTKALTNSAMPPLLKTFLVDDSVQFSSLQECKIESCGCLENKWLV